MVTITKRLVALLLCLLLMTACVGCNEKTQAMQEKPLPVDLYRSIASLWDVLPENASSALKEASRSHSQAYWARREPLSDLIFAQLVKSDLSGDLRLRSVANDFARAFLSSAWAVNLPDAVVVSVKIVEHPDQALATEGQRAKYDKLAIELTDTLGNCYIVCFADWTAMLYQDGTLLESHNAKVIY